MSQENLCIGGINFNTNDNFIHNVTEYPTQISKSQIKYIDLLQGIKDKTINTKNLVIQDKNKEKWYYDEMEGHFYQKINGFKSLFLTDLDDCELLDIYVDILYEPDKKQINTVNDNLKDINEIAITNIKQLLEDLYIDLDQDIDACQGCTEDLDIKLDKLKVYSYLINILGGDVTKNQKEMLDRWYKHKKEKQLLDNNVLQSKYIKIPFKILTSKSVKDKLLVDIVDNINDIKKYILKNL